MNKRAWVAGVTLLVVAVAIAFAIRGSGHAGQESAPASAAKSNVDSSVVTYPQGAPQLSMLRSEPVANVPVPLSDALPGRIAYNDNATARIYAPVAGRIVALKSQAGDRVAAGATLAVIDAADFGTARADLDKARADEERKRLAYARARDLGAGEGIAEKDLEAAKADYDAARAETARAQQRVRNLNPRGLTVEGQQIALTSPIQGVVSERNATPALEVAPGATTPIFVVTDPRKLWVLIDLPERLLGSVRSGAKVLVESDAFPGEQFMARIAQVGRTVDTNTRRVLVRAEVDNPAEKLLPEMFVRALILQDKGQGTRVPNSAVINRGVYSYVFVETAPGRFERRRIDIAVRGADSSYVSSGLAGGDKVVTTGAILLDAVAGAGQRS